MTVSVLDLLRIGIGPSSSHTVGPMRAARAFALDLERSGLLDATRSVRVELFGSLGATGRGHGSDKAVLLGLLGQTPEDVDVAEDASWFWTTKNTCARWRRSRSRSWASPSSRCRPARRPSRGTETPARQGAPSTW